tara:strand:- start:1569 stop:2558 length:990 start_codon:yes stop_codon:yes gene_type:complete
MTPKGKKNLFIGLAITTIVGAAGYLIWSMQPKDKSKTDETPEVDETKTNTSTNSGGGNSSSNSSSGSSTPPTRSQLATDYRAWANSTDELNKKYGKKSEYDLDEIGSANSWFDKSYKAGKTEYEAYLKEVSMPTPSTLPAILKPVYDAITWGKKLGKTAAGLEYIRLANSKGIQYYWFSNGTYKIWDTKTKKSLSSGGFSNAGKTMTGTKGVHKGTTWTKDSPEAAALYAYNDPNQKLSHTPATYTDAVVKMYDAMKGGGTKVSTFWKWWDYMTQTGADWSKFISLFGKKDGYTFGQWVKGEDALTTLQAKKRMNDSMERIGYGNATKW